MPGASRSDSALAAAKAGVVQLGGWGMKEHRSLGTHLDVRDELAQLVLHLVVAPVQPEAPGCQDGLLVGVPQHGDVPASHTALSPSWLPWSACTLGGLLTRTSLSHLSMWKPLPWETLWPMAVRVLSSLGSGKSALVTSCSNSSVSMAANRFFYLTPDISGLRGCAWDF